MIGFGLESFLVTAFNGIYAYKRAPILFGQ